MLSLLGGLSGGGWKGKCTSLHFPAALFELRFFSALSPDRVQHFEGGPLEEWYGQAFDLLNAFNTYILQRPS